MHDFIQQLPKAELHVHLEGTLEPEHIFTLAERNGIELEYRTPQDIVAAYDFHDLPSFLKIYYAAMDVLRTKRTTSTSSRCTTSAVPQRRTSSTSSRSSTRRPIRAAVSLSTR
jgi:adenosine deaminase